MLGRITCAIALCIACSNGSSNHQDAASKTDGKVFMDAKAGSGDAGGSGDGGLPACTGLLYDPCNAAASNCMGAETCHDFNGVSECTQTCSAANPCPNQNGNAVTCNNMGICKAAAPNTDCTAP